MRERFLFWGAVAACIVVGAARMWPVYTTYSQTYDEPQHIACGMEWLDLGAYHYQMAYSPLARITVAIGPYLRGARSCGRANFWDEGNAILHTNGQYRENLRAARLGILLFYALACVLVGHWARRWYGTAAGVASVALFSTLPPVLGHASLATTDMASTAASFAALYSLVLWLEAPTGRRTLWLGAAVATALLMKINAVPFLGACGATAVVYWRLRQGPAMRGRLLRRAGVAALLAGALVWAGFRFELTSFSEYRGRHDFAEKWIPRPLILRQAVSRAMETPLPLMHVVRAIREGFRRDALGQPSYLLGETRLHGWWYFFLVALAVKTPLGFLLLAGAGSVALLRGIGKRPWPEALPALCAPAVLLVYLPLRVDMGVRYILQIYPLLSLAAGYVVGEWWGRGGASWRRVAVGLLVAAAGWESVRAHPDYLPYFNPLVGDAPERVLAESDLDWGQDLGRLSRRLRELNVEQVWISYFGSADLDRAGLPPYRKLPAGERVSGWVAVSVRNLVMEPAARANAWLKELRPVEVVGKTIWLYRVP